MAMATSTFSPPPASRLSLKPQAGSKPYLLLSFPRFRACHRLARATAGEAPVEALSKQEEETALPSTPAACNGAAASASAAVEAEAEAPAVPRFRDSRWMNGTWDLNRFEKGGAVDWDGVIDAEARRRKWLEDYPEATNTNEAVVFDTSIIPWWAWMKRFHLPEAEKLNGRAAMVGFFMAYFVDSLTGVGLVDQMGNFFLQNPAVCCRGWCAAFSIFSPYVAFILTSLLFPYLVGLGIFRRTKHLRRLVKSMNSFLY